MGRFLGIIPRGGVARITHSRLFKKMAHKAFEQCDKDGNGVLDEKELHICLLLLYDKLNAKLPCHVRVPRPEVVREMFERYVSADGTLGEEQFLEVAQDVLASDRHWHESVVVMITLTVGLQLALFPLIGRGLGKVSKELEVPVAEKISPALWATGIAKLYKLVRIALPVLP